MIPVKNIFFDFGRTIVEHPADEAGIKIIAKTGITDMSSILFLQKEVFSGEKYLNFLDEDSMQRSEYIERLSAAVPPDLRPFAISAANYSLEQLPTISGMVEMLERLKNSGLKIYITSNLDKYHAEQLRYGSLSKYFDDFAISSELKVRKPYKEFFQGACRKFGVAAEECILIDDLEDNIAGAALCNIRGFVFKGDAVAAEEYINKNR